MIVFLQATIKIINLLLKVSSWKTVWTPRVRSQVWDGIRIRLFVRNEKNLWDAKHRASGQNTVRLSASCNYHAMHGMPHFHITYAQDGDFVTKSIHSCLLWLMEIPATPWTRATAVFTTVPRHATSQSRCIMKEMDCWRKVRDTIVTTVVVPKQLMRVWHVVCGGAGAGLVVAVGLGLGSVSN